MKVKLLSCIRLLATPWTAAYQAPLSMGFSRQEYWRRVPLPSPKNTLQGINSRISEAEEQISEVEDKMVEITSKELDKVKRMKRTEDSLRDLWDSIKCTNIIIIGVPEEEEKKKGYEKIFEEIIVENFPNMEKEIVNQVPRGTKSPIQDKPEEKHTNTHTNQTNKD